MSVRLWVGGVVVALGLSAWAVAQTAATKPKRPPGAKGADVELVERLLSARREYQTTLESLRAHYISVGDIDRARWAEDELVQFHRINKQAYHLPLDVPPPTLQANYNIPEANELYRQAMTYKDKGWGTDYIDNQRRAELLLQKLLSNHPQSNKISDSAYQLGDIYESKAFHQYERSAQYFERCFQWDTKTHFDARLRSARLYERVGERNKAIEIYRLVTTWETDPRRTEEAQKKIIELTGKK